MENIECSLQKGDIVRLKRGFDRSFDGIAVRRAALPLKEGAKYEVVEFQHRNPGVVVLREVRTFRIAGARHVIELGSEPFPYTADIFQRLCKLEPGRPVVRIAARLQFLGINWGRKYRRRGVRF